MVIACFGDSLIYGFLFGSEYSWIRTVEWETGHRLLNYGNCGETTIDIGQRLRFGILPDADALIFFGGANDVLQLMPKEESCAELKRVIAFSAEKKLPLCVVLPLLSGEETCNERLQLMRDEFERLCEGKVMTLDLMHAIGTTQEEIAEAYLDGFHPRAEVYERMGKYAAPLIAKWCETKLKKIR